ncbi:MAG: hypothetical protein RLZZ319_61 [Actinomycetota bacterium]|jgi:hypothetical protein
MPAATFPVVGAIAPLVTSLILWVVTGSAFALLGAVIAPTMVVAHFLDARRRARNTEREKEATRVREEAIRREVELRERRSRIAAENRLRPSIADIAASAEWVPSRSGDAVVRLGHLADGSPWLVTLEGGLAVAGEGSAADAVWASAFVHGCAQLGEPTGSDADWVWPGGVRLVRGSSPDVARTVRCSGSLVESVVERGGLPASGDWVADDTRRAPEVLARIRGRCGALNFSDRSRCSSGLGLAGAQPFVMSPTNDTPHALIVGRTGSGKSLALSALVLDWAERFSPDELTVVGIDFKGGATLNRFEQIPHLAALITDLDDGVVPRVLAGLAAEMRRREIALRAQGVSRVDDARGVPRLVVVIDEAHEFVRRHPEAHDVLVDIARRGRSLGVHLLIAVQQTHALRDSLLANVPVRIALAANTPYEVGQALGRPTSVVPTRGRALVTMGDGSVRDVEVRVVADGDIDSAQSGKRPTPPWCAPLRSPLTRAGRPGFGMLDDVDSASQHPAEWGPNDGDVLVVGARGSGRTTALRQLVDGLDATWVRRLADLDAPRRVIVIDNLDRMLSRATPAESTALVESISRLRGVSPRPVILYSSATPMPRVTGSIANVLTLRLATIDEHRATGASTATWTADAAPGTGVWKGVRVVVYARTDSMVTESIP